MARRILIAEDNDRVVTALSQLLEGRGLTVERACDGVEALQKIVARSPDLLLLDLRLPRLSGIEVLKKLRRSARTAALPVIVSSGLSRDDSSAAEVAGLGVADYLQKPYPPSRLLASIERALPGALQAPRASIDRHLHSAFSRRFSGSLTLNTEGGKKVLLLAGVPVSLRPGFVHRDFGDYLRRKGLLSAEEYDYFRGEGSCRQDVLVRMGCLEYPELLRESIDYLNEELVEGFASPPHSVQETPLAVPPELEPLGLNMAQLFHRGYRRHPRAAGGDRLVERCGGKYVATTTEYYRHINFLSLDLQEKELLNRLDGTRTLEACLAGDRKLLPLAATLRIFGMIALSDRPLAPAPVPDHPLRSLFNALEEELEVEMPDEPLESFADLADAGEDLVFAAPGDGSAEGEGAAPAGSELAEKVRRVHGEFAEKNYYQVFDLNPGKFSIDALKERYFALTREYGPETLMQLSGEEASKVEEILDRVATAYNTLSDVVKKERYDELLGSDRMGLGQKGDDRFQAQVQFQSGKVFLQMEDWDSAEKALQDACNIDPNSGAYLAHLAWALFRNPKNAGSRAMLEKSKQMLNRAIAMERTAEAFAFKGWMLFEAGQESLAEGEFNKALKLDARQMLARRGLRTLQEKREQEKKGLFRKMFR